MEEELFTIVDDRNRPVFTQEGMDGHFSLCSTFGCMLTFTRKIGWSQMMHYVKWSHGHSGEGRIKVYPAKVTMVIERILIN